MEILLILITWLLQTSATGFAFFYALDYMEGRRVGSRKSRRVLLLPAGTCIAALSNLLLHRIVGLGTHPIGETFAAVFFAALLACAVSAAAIFRQFGRKHITTRKARPDHLPATGHFQQAG